VTITVTLNRAFDIAFALNCGRFALGEWFGFDGRVSLFSVKFAQVAELVDALVSGTSG
jgi:hypothetical protein